MLRPVTAACFAFACAAPIAGSANVPWFSAPTAKVVAQPVTFTNAGATLRGTLYLPNTTDRVPAIVVFHGASEPLASTPLYAHLREGLPAMGIAVLLFDRRGTGASTGNRDVVYQTLADDGIAGAQAIRALPQIDAARVGYWGISQGGWLATVAATRDPLAAFAVAVSAPLVTAESQMEFAMTNRLNVMGYGPSDVDAMLAARRALDGYFRGVDTRAQAVAALQSIAEKPWFDQMYLPKPSAVPADPAASSWRGQMDVDFFATVARVKIPMLFLMGSNDPWTPVTATVGKLREIARGQPLVQYAVVPNANHLMMTPPVPETMNDADPAQVAVEEPQAPVYFMLLGAWLSRTLERPETSAATPQ
ncbi:MAG TPA: alpha/beta fold hydrolase [Candidatus Cybelea sp.]|jgi:hypothetical protein|nr:alpha/beta fold hydrolase [Candidatus Cybelea sp.]